MIVLDAGAMVAYLANEPGGDMVREHLEEADVPIYAHAVNLLEVFYHYSRATDVLTARRFLDALRADGIQRREDMDAAFLHKARRVPMRKAKSAVRPFHKHAVTGALLWRLLHLKRYTYIV